MAGGKRSRTVDISVKSGWEHYNYKRTKVTCSQKLGKISGIGSAPLASLMAVGVWWWALYLGGSCVPVRMVGLG